MFALSRIFEHLMRKSRFFAFYQRRFAKGIDEENPFGINSFIGLEARNPFFKLRSVFFCGRFLFAFHLNDSVLTFEPDNKVVTSSFSMFRFYAKLAKHLNHFINERIALGRKKNFQIFFRS